MSMSRGKWHEPQDCVFADSAQQTAHSRRIDTRSRPQSLRNRSAIASRPQSLRHREPSARSISVRVACFLLRGRVRAECRCCCSQGRSAAGMSVELLLILGNEGGERGMSVQSAPRRHRAASSFLFSSPLRSSSSSCEKAERERSKSDFVDDSRLTVVTETARSCHRNSISQHPHSLTMT